MNILVTGGAGYIGSIVAEELLRAGHKVLAYDNLAQGHRSAIPEGATFVRADLGDREKLKESLKRHKVEAVMHFAALIEAGESMERPALYLHNNVTNTIALLEMVLEHGIERFVLSSTAGVYAASNEPLRECDPLEPASLYGETKLMIERTLAWLDRLCGLRYASLRYFNAAGASPERGEDHRPESHLIPRLLQVALGEREHIEIYGTDYPSPDGTCVRDYIHVVDLARAHLLALEALEHGSCIYNLGNGHGFSVREVIQAARDVTGHPIPALEKPRRPGDAPILVASSEKIKAELGWEPLHPDLKSIIESAWRWRRAHPQGYLD